MMACEEERRAGLRSGRVSLILRPSPSGSRSAFSVAEYRELVQADGEFDSVEVIVVGNPGQADEPGSAEESGNGSSGCGLRGV